MELLTSKMKEMKDKTIWTGIKEHKKQIILWGGIILIAVPVIVYGLSEISLLPVTGGNDWAGFWGGYMGAIIGGVCTFVGVSRTIKYEREKSEGEKERSVLPYMALSTLKTNFDLYFTDTGDIQEVNSFEQREKHMLQQYVFLLDGNDVRIQEDLRCTCINKDVSTFLPIKLENVGNGTAVNFRVGVHTKEIAWTDRKYTPTKHIKQGESFNIFILFKDVTKYQVGESFKLRIIYKNIFSQNYLQEYEISVEEGYKVRLDLTGEQRRVIDKGDRLYKQGIK